MSTMKGSSLRPEEEVMEPQGASPGAFRDRLCSAIRESGLTALEIEALGGPDDSWTRRMLRTERASHYLPDLSSSILLALALAWSKEPKAPQGRTVWALRTLEDLQQLCQLHHLARPESARLLRTTAVAEPCASPQERELPEWAQA